jgi:tetratricopeptide (TPR) repeat protein
VDALLEGTVERSENQVKVRVQLIEAASDRHLWAETYQRPLQNILQLESELAQDIASQIRVHMTPKEREHIAHTRAVNSEAFQDYLLGRHYWGLRNPDSLQQAVKYFQRAIDKDPDYALPYSGLADCYIVLPMLVGFPPPDEAFGKAREYAARALALDDTLAEAHTSAADVNLYYKWDFAGAEREFRRALELSPNYATAHQWYGEYLTAFGRHAEALHEYERAEVLDPLSAIVQVQLANGYRQAGQNDEAIKHYRKALELDPKFASVGEGLSVTLWRQGKYQESIQALEVMCHSGERWRALCGTTVEGMKQAYEAGDKRAVLQKRMEFHKRWVRPDYYVARDYAELGNVDMALRYLSRTHEHRDPELFSVITDPEFDFMRADLRFQSVMQRLKNPSPAS